MSQRLPIPLAEEVRAWRQADPDPATGAELDELVAAGDVAELSRRFVARLEFGTAGIRAPLGAGPARMNRLAVARIGLGLAEAFVALRPPDGAGQGTLDAVVGYDGRHGSATFAEDLARMLERRSLSVAVLPTPVPTPVLAFAVRHLGATWGLMVTASHNPPQDNGLKVYGADGAQIIAPTDGWLAEHIADADWRSLPEGWAEEPLRASRPEGVVDAYAAQVVGALSAEPTSVPGELRVVHSALHGVGSPTLRATFSLAGLRAPEPVPEQDAPDPDFPTVAFPNPEEPGALDLALERARRSGADLVVVNDPDADRLAVALPHALGDWRALSGDELGGLLGDWALGRRWTAEAEQPVVATTVVSSSLLRKLAVASGARCVTTLTGFKWIVRAAGAGRRPRFGYEEALGYAVLPDVVADKDGISAALAVVLLASALAREGRRIQDRLDELALAHGVHVTAQRSVRLPEGASLAELAELMRRARRDPPRALGGEPVEVADLAEPTRVPVDLAGGIAERSPGELVPPADVLIWRGEGMRACLRPSGTEPKLKVYLEAVEPPGALDLGAARADAARRAASLGDEVLDRLGLGPGTTKEAKRDG